ncbi:MAG: type II toxin-antitoxin system RelE/ParE family toxin [Pseudomonadota bacterium]
MSHYKLTSGARATLVDIYVYTHNTWGLQQADTYLEGFYGCFEDIAAKRVLWRPIPSEYEVEGFFTRYEKHLIYWRHIGDGELFIVAILHTSMLQHERLKQAFSPSE